MISQFPKSAKYVANNLDALQDEVIARRNEPGEPTSGLVYETMELLKSEGCTGDLRWEAYNLITVITINTPDE